MQEPLARPWPESDDEFSRESSNATISETPKHIANSAAEMAFAWAELADRELANENDLSQRFADSFDRSRNFLLSRFSLGISPAAVAEAFFDWWIHIASSPGRQIQIAEKAVRKTLRLANFAASCACQATPGKPCIEPLTHDKRFSAPQWQTFPFNIIYQSFLLQQQWWHVATKGVRGVRRSTRRGQISGCGKCSTSCLRRTSC